MFIFLIKVVLQLRINYETRKTNKANFKRNKIAFGRFGYDNESLEYEKKEFTEDDELLRKRPDYIIYGKDFNFCFVEAKLGAFDGVKIKDIDVKGYKYWNKTFPVWIYVYYAKAKRYELIKLNVVDAHFVANIHDEWQLQVKESQADYIGRLGIECIEKVTEQFKMRCDLTGEYKVGGNWSETH